MTDLLYELREVARFFRRGDQTIRALDGITLEIAAGEIVALEGPSGSGKTTLLQLLGALDRPSEGSVAFEGRDLAELPDRELAMLRLDAFGFVFQQFNLISTLTSLQNVEAALAPKNLNDTDLRRRAAALLDEVGLGDRGSHVPAQLSGGEQQRVAIARALVGDPRVVLADEPTGNLDSGTGGEIIELLTTLAVRRGTTIVVATHDAELASRAPRRIAMRDGRVVGTDEAAVLAGR